MTDARAVDVTAVIDQERFGRFQLRVAALCAVIAMLDGFDTQAIAYVAPAIAEAWGVPVAGFGPVFGAGLVGLTVGALVFGPVADRFGRKRVILLCTAWFGLFACATAWATDLPSLIALRFLTGVGLGGAMPNIIALTSEYAPARRRAFTVTLMFSGFPLGSTLGGLLSAKLIPAFGWEAVFLLGGALPLLLLPVLVLAMPESVRFLVANGRRPERVAAILGRIAPDRRFAAGTPFVLPEERLEGFSVRHLFAERRAPLTLLVWLAYFANLLVMYLLVNWLPSFLREAGQTIETAIVSTALFNLGGVVGGIALGSLIDRFGAPATLGSAYAAAALGVAVTAAVGGDATLLMPVVFGVGFAIVGAQTGMHPLTAGLYPTAVRATGLGWALGVGRVGSIVGPVVGGLLLGAGWDPRSILLLAAVPALVASLAVLSLGMTLRPAQAAARA